jgi:hypothetical protein
MHMCSNCGKLTHTCDICGTQLESISAVKKHQVESKICKKARTMTAGTLHEELAKLSIVVKIAEPIKCRQRRNSLPILAYISTK